MSRLRLTCRGEMWLAGLRFTARLIACAAFLLAFWWMMLVLGLM